MDREYQQWLQGVEKAERLINLLKQQEYENNDCETIILFAG